MAARSLKFRVFVSVFLLVLASGTLVGLLTAHYYWRGLREAMRAEASELAQRVALQAADKVLINDLVGVQRLLDSHQASNPKLGYLLLVRDGEVVGHTFDRGVPVALLEDLQGEAPAKALLTEVASTTGRRYLDVVWPVMEGRAGLLRLGLREAPFQARLRELLADIALITLAVLVLSLGLCFIFARQIARPLERLVEATERVSGGDWDSRVEVNHGLGEVERLSASFNRMVDRLAEKARQLEAQHQDLKRAHRQTRTSCRIIQELGALNDAGQIGTLLLGRLRDSLRCRDLLVLVPLKEPEGLLLMGRDGMQRLGEGESLDELLRMLGQVGETRFMAREELPSRLLARMDPECPRMAWIPIGLEGRVPGALLLGCAPEGPCRRCELEFAEMVVNQAGGSLLRALRQIEESHNLAGRVEREQGFCGMVGKAAGMRKVYQLICDVAPTDSTVLILGESGTGKELAARAIHLSSPRSQAPFVVIDCSAYPSTLLESELFGHEKGAFTGANRTKPGRFEQAQGGTVFLDEVGEVPLSAQTKLLRVLQTHRFERLGGERTLDMDVRILAATNKDLLEEVKQGRFREDLYYRLNVFPLRLPPLRRRLNDIPLLAQRFLERFASEQGKRLEGFSPEALRLLLDHTWPGNVRELENVVERAAILARERLVQPWDLPEELQRRLARADGSLERHTRRAIVEALDSCGWNKKLAASRLGISRTTLYRKIRKYGLEKPTCH